MSKKLKPTKYSTDGLIENQYESGGKEGGTLPIFHTHLLDALQFYKSKSFRNSAGDSIFIL